MVAVLRGFILLGFTVVFSISTINPSIYNIKINKDPIRLSEVKENHFEITSLYGQQFSCTIPSTVFLQKPSSVSFEKTNAELQKVLSSWNISDCLVQSTGWWNYKLCIGKEIIQFHNEKDVTVVTLTLGSYSKDFDWNHADQSDLQVWNKYHSQFYENGDICDVTGRHRSTEVQFICRPEMQTPAIIDATEVVTCTYVIRVAAADLCNVAALVPHENIKPGDLVCSPCLSDEDFLKFEEAENQRAIRQTLLEEKKALQKILLNLPTLRNSYREKILRSRRSYRRRLMMWNSMTAKRLSQQYVNFLTLVQDNFEQLKQFSVKDILGLRDFRKRPTVALDMKYDTLNDSNLDNLMSLLREILAFQVPAQIGTYNQTLEIASLLLNHVRRSFEYSIEIRRQPKTMEMLAGYINILRQISSIKSIEVLAKVQKALLRHPPNQLYRPYFKDHSFQEYIVSPHLEIERSALDILNTTIELSRTTLKVMFLENYFSTFLNGAYSIKTLGKDLDDGVSLSNKKSADSRIQKLTQIREVLESPKIRTALNQLLVQNERSLSLKATIEPLSEDKMALIISIHTESELNSHHEENAKNYKTKLNFE